MRTTILATAALAAWLTWSSAAFAQVQALASDGWGEAVPTPNTLPFGAPAPPTGELPTMSEPAASPAIGGSMSCGCGTSCGVSCGTACGDACDPWWKHRHAAFGEYLYLMPRNFDVPFAAEVNGPTWTQPNPFANRGIQVGRTATTDMDYDSGFRTGFAYALSDCASLGATYTYFQTEGEGSISSTGDVRSLVAHPLTLGGASDVAQASAAQDIEFQLADLEYRWLYHAGRCHALNFILGARYAHYEQNFDSTFAGTFTRQVATDIVFDGAGLRVGADFERQACSRGIFVYGKSFANFLVGTFQADYFQGSTLSATEVETSWEDDRAIAMLEMELGLGWQNQTGNLRATAGYFITSWFNTVSTETYIDAVQRSSFVHAEDAVVFDGLTARLELRY